MVTVMVTFPDVATAESVVHALVEESLIACGNLVPGAKSVYSWNGQIETESEVMAWLQTRDELVDRVFARVSALHPYDVPQMVALPGRTAESYEAWLQDVTVEANSPDSQ